MKCTWASGNRTILLASNSSWNLVNFRAPIIAALKSCGYRVDAAVPDDKSAQALRTFGVEVHHVPVDARGFSPLGDARLFLSYRNLLRRLNPSVLLPFTAKPNIYGSAAASHLGIPVVNTITGLGTGFLSGRALESIVSGLYRWGLRRSRRVFFHNAEDSALFIKRGLVTATQAGVVPGSGIDLHRFAPVESAPASRQPTFLFIGRFLKDKGAIEFAQAAAMLKVSRAARFQMLGSVEDHPKAAPRELFDKLARDGTIEILEPTDDVRPFIADADCIVLPSYREGLPRVLLEGSAMAKPLIATDVPGCRQVLEDGVTGLLCEPRCARSLAEAMTKFIDLPAGERAAMGARGRQRIAREFSQDRVVAIYLEALRELGA